MEWPSTGEQVRRMEEAFEIIDRLLDGERLDHEGRFFRTSEAYLHTRGERRPPVYASAFGPDTAGREPGEVILQTGMSWAEDDDDALEGATSSAPIRASTPRGSAKSSCWVPRSSASRMRRAPIRSAPCVRTASACCGR
jgi:alkanesulfonate monooxygenase SsuD/methylene tetrahydromethanopterin reductase-like flavin-dependent oxidoreductase (luciferase family)